MNLINLGIGEPLFNINSFDRLYTADVRRDFDARLACSFRYAPPSGDQESLHILHSILGTKVSHPDSCILTHGALGGIDLVARSFRNECDTVFLLDPTYKEAITIFRRLSFNVKTIPITPNGNIDVNAFHKALRRHKSICYLITCLNNPDGRTLKKELLQRLSRVMADNSTILIEDDVYRKLLFNQEETPPSLFETLLEMNLEFPAYRISSLSKICMPGLRVGLVEASSVTNRDHLIHYKTDFGLSPVLTSFASSLCKDSGLLESYIQKLKGRLSTGLDSLYSGLNPESFGGCSQKPQGGYFLWVRVPSQINMTDFRDHTLKKGISYSDGSLFRHTPRSREQFLRLSYGFYEPDTLYQAGSVLRQSVEELS